MMNSSDSQFIKANSKEIIEGSGELIVRRRLKTALPPDSYDSAFGEVTKESENQYDEVEFRGKVFWDITDKKFQEIFGADKTASAYVHVPFTIDVRAQDILVIRGSDYEVAELAEASLRGFNICRLLIRSAQ